MSKKSNNLQAFSEKQHQSGKWSSRKSYPPVPFIKYLINLISLKRYFVYSLSKDRSINFLLDMGCGKGAYSKWYLRNNKKSKIVAMDWSYKALKEINQHTNIFPVVADAQKMPFKPGVFDSAFSVDTLGHIENPQLALNELNRILIPDSIFFIHSECSDYQQRWPDKNLIRKLGKDFIAEKDGHFFIKGSSDLYKLFHSTFSVVKFLSPAGLTGWLTGYPESYRPLFKKAKMTIPYIISLPFFIIRSIPIFRQLLQLLNAIINRIEIYFKISGGGSVFAVLKKRNN